MPSPFLARRRRGGALWQRTDPRARLLAVAAVSGALLAARDGSGLAAGAAGLAALLAATGTGPRAALAALRPFRILLLLTAGLQLLFTPGEPLLGGILPGAFTVQGAAAAALALARLGGAVAASAALVATTSPLELGRSLGWAIAPLRVFGLRVREISLVSTLGFQFFPVLLEESARIRAALESRGVSLRHPRRRLRARALLLWVLAVLFGMVERSARLAAALDAKGFGIERPLRHRFPPWSAESSLATAGSAALIGAAALLAWR